MNDPQKIHPLTGHPILPVGFRCDGRAIWPILGGSGQEPPPADGDVDAAAKAAADKAAADKAAADKAAADAKNKDDKSGSDKDGGDGDDDRGYPKDTSLADMKPEEREAYWKYHARKHEKAVQSLVGKDMTPEKVAELIANAEKAERDAMSAQEKAVADARKEAREEALKEARALSVRAIIDAHVAASGLDKDDADAQDVIDAVQALDPSQFIKDDHVDADRLTKVLARIVPEGGGGRNQSGTWPDTGQGNRQTGTGSARDAGRAEAERRGYLKAGDA